MDDQDLSYMSQFQIIEYLGLLHILEHLVLQHKKAHAFTWTLSSFLSKLYNNYIKETRNFECYY